MNKAICERCFGTGKEPDNVMTAGGLKAKRELAGVSQKSIAKFMGVTASYLCDLESAKRQWNHSLVEAYEEGIRRLKSVKVR